MENRSTIFPDITKKDHVQVRIIWKNHLFKIFEENMVFPITF